MDEWAAAVKEATPLFFRAYRAGNVTDAEQHGKRVLFACRQYIDVARDRALRQASIMSMWKRVPDTQNMRHYEEISAQVSAILQDLGINPLRECCALDDGDTESLLERSPPVPARTSHQKHIRTPTPKRIGRDRTRELRTITRELNQVSTFVGAIQGLVEQQEPAVQRIDANLEAGHAKMQRSAVALERHYREKYLSHQKPLAAICLRYTVLVGLAFFFLAILISF